MRYLSVCSGIEAASVAWEPMGWSPVGFSEIEPFPSAVLAHHWPDVPNLGDMNNYEEWKNLGAIDLLAGGTPCQSFSVAGLRRGLKDPRGGLMLTYLEIAKHFRPRWIVWENVPGVLSSDGGRDFGSFLGALGDLGYGWAYRVLDAQWIRTQRHPRAVPQRRRRVFVVGCLGDRTRAAKVLFESQSVCRDSAESRKKKEDVAGTFKARARSGGWCQDVDLASSGYMQVAGALDTECGGNKLTHQTLLNGHALAVGALSADDGEQGLTTVQAAASGMLIAFQQNTRDEVRLIGGDGKIAGALAAEAGMKQQNYLAPARMVAFGEYVADGTASAMKARDYKDATDLVAVDAYNQTVSDTSQALSSSASDIHHTGGAIVPAISKSVRTMSGGVVAPTLTSANDPSRSPQSSEITQQVTAVHGACMAVRRLTPTECERLQGFPDNHTLIPWKKKPADQCPDGPRYKALGNSMAVNCMEWIGQRIDFYDKQS
jgi:DNA (cytosine-5)-methyltransferase 1